MFAVIHNEICRNILPIQADADEYDEVLHPHVAFVSHVTQPLRNCALTIICMCRRMSLYSNAANMPDRTDAVARVQYDCIHVLLQNQCRAMLHNSYCT